MSSQAPPRWDRQMQRRLVRGEESALSELYDRFASLIHHLANKIVDDPDAADEITREVFVRVWEHPEEFDPKQSNMRSWIALLTEREAVSRLRRAEYDDEGSTAETEAKVHAASAAARADYIVSSMPEPLRRALQLTYNEGRSYRAAAAELGVSESEAKSRVRLGLLLLSTAADDPEGRRELQP